MDLINKDIQLYTNKVMQKVPSYYNMPKTKGNTVKNIETKRNSDSKSKKR